MIRLYRGHPLLGCRQHSRLVREMWWRPVQVAQFAFELGNVTFANMWVALGSLSLASGWAILAGRGEPARPGWPAGLGWWALAAGAGFLVARMTWPTYVWVIPYVPFWVWVLVVSTRMLRTRR